MPGTWTSLGTKTAGQTVSASSDWNPLVNDVEWLGRDRPECKVYRSSALPISDVTETNVAWDADQWDDWNMHNTGAFTSRLVCPVAGRYKFTASLRMDTAAYDYYLQVRLSGNPFLTGLDTRKAGIAHAVTDWGDQVVARYNCVAGDYFEVGFWHNRGSALNVRTNSWAELVWEGDH